MRQAAEFDYLTKVYNRKSFMYKIKEILKLSKRYKQKTSILYFDINNFKQVNDTHGHLVGDEVLKFFTNNIKLSIRESDLLGRIGGDEFVLALPNTDQNSIKIIIDKIQKKFKKPFEYDGITIKVGFSYGCAIYPDDSDNIDKLIEIADKRMYKYKSNFKKNL
ncbi:GGDEF domain-containing protein [Marinitoga aeolica]|uniref:GGDEF domain-containing protein n=1 Tax=Marinitoga aeolica TaxID=2809031 RepID=A0ABY8PP21_9BACT|nr:GGDEF domain-containing protein [Marinitoga aeolica]WGS64387.1 GGDEF domain-containing protein [Marinitoga aeolica]